MFPEKRHYGKFSPTETGKIPNQTPINVTFANNLSACALQCLRDFLLCVSVAYNSATGSCSFYPDFFFISLSSSTKTKIYVLQPYWAFDQVVTRVNDVNNCYKTILYWHLLTIRIKKMFLLGFQTLETKALDFFFITEL